MEGMFGGTSLRIADLGRLDVKYPFIAFMPQWDFFKFPARERQALCLVKVMMSAEAVDLIHDGGRIAA